MLALALVVVLLATQVAIAKASTVTVEVIDRNGERVAGATIMLCNTTKCPWTKETDPNGMATIEVPEGTYLLLVLKDELSIIDIVSVENSTKVLLDLRNTPCAQIDSNPVHVTFKVVPLAYNKTIELSTPTNLYTRMVLDIEFPRETEHFPFIYKLEKIEYDGNIVENKTTIKLAMDRDYNVTVYYSKQFIASLDTPILLALAVIVVAGVVVAWKVASVTARETVEGHYMRFVKKK